jgi:3-dehydroquinate dehydratase
LPIPRAEEKDVASYHAFSSEPLFAEIHNSFSPVLMTPNQTPNSYHMSGVLFYQISKEHTSYHAFSSEPLFAEINNLPSPQS